MKKRKDLRLPNNYGGVVYLGENRRKPFGARITIGFEPKGEKDGVMQYRQKYKYLGFFEKRTQALECLIEFNKNPYDMKNQRLTFKDVYTDWSSKHYNRVSENTIKSYKTAFNKCEKIHDVYFVDLKTKQLQDVIDGASSSIAKSIKLLLGLIYKYALRHEIVSKNYAEFLELPKNEKKQLPRPFSKNDIDKLWSMEGNENVDMLLILLFSGMRIGELLILENENIHLEERYIIGGIKTQAGTDRIIPIHKEIEHIFKRNIFQGQKYLFFNRNGKAKAYTNVHKKTAELLKWAGINHTFHDARHTFISQSQRLGIDNLTLKRIVGHSDKDITEHYTHKSKEDLIKAIDKFYY